MSNPILQIIIASTRPGRVGPAVAAWIYERAVEHGGFDVELVDLAEVNLPMFDEPKHPRFGDYTHAHTKAWSAIVARADAFVFVSPEYNYSLPPSLLNAIDFLHREWAYKPAGFVSYGGVSGGLRAVQMIKQTLSALKVVPITEAVALPLFTTALDAETGRFSPPEVQTRAGIAMLSEILRWAGALRSLRSID